MSTEMTAAAEKSAEKIEGVVVLATATLLPLLQALVAVLVVDFARLGVDEGFVSFGDFDELLFRGVIATEGGKESAGVVGEERKRRYSMPTYGFLSGWNFLES